MTLSVIFNGHELNEFLGVTSDFERGIGTERENNLLEVGSSNFKQYQGYRLKENRIPMPFVIRYNLTEKRRELASILNVDEPKKLIFGDEPDKYYLAVPTGKVGLSENNFLGKGEILWEVPDGRAHAVEEKTFTGTTEIEVINGGSYGTFPLLNVEMEGDNGVVALFTEDGAIIQIGNPDEIDGVPYQKQEMVIDERWNGTSMPANWSKNTGKIRYTTYVANGQPNKIKGEWDFTTDADAVRPSYSGNLEPVWAGPTLHRDIPKNSNGSNTANFTYKNRFTFDAINRTVGRIELNLQSGDDIPLSFVMRDSSTSNAEIRYEIWIQGKRYIDKALDRTKFKSGFFQVEINKYDGKIEFKIVDIKAISNEIVTGSSVEIQSWYVSGMEDVPITSLTTWIHRFQNESWTGINLTDTKFTWLNVDKWNDLANTFSKGDMLSIDTSSATISVNGVQSTVLGALGNEWDKFEIPPGKHKIYVMVSSWAEAPEVSLSIREAYL